METKASKTQSARLKLQLPVRNNAIDKFSSYRLQVFIRVVGGVQLEKIKKKNIIRQLRFPFSYLYESWHKNIETKII